MKTGRLSTLLMAAAILSAAPLRADTFAYFLAGAFGTLDLTTGVYTNINSTVGGANESGLDASGGLLYTEANGSPGDCLFPIDPANGNYIPNSSTPIGCTLPLSKAFGQSTTGFYIAGTDSNLYSINLAGNLPSEIGSRPVQYEPSSPVGLPCLRKGRSSSTAKVLESPQSRIIDQKLVRVAETLWGIVFQSEGARLRSRQGFFGGRGTIRRGLAPKTP